MVTFSGVSTIAGMQNARKPMFAGKPLEPEKPVDPDKLRRAEQNLKNALSVQGKLANYTGEADSDEKFTVSAVVPHLQGYNILIEHMHDASEAEIERMMSRIPGLRPELGKRNSYYYSQEGEVLKVAVVKMQYL